MMFSEKRIHPISMLNSFIDGAKQMVFPFIVILFSQSKATGGFYLGGYLLYSSIAVIIVYSLYLFLKWYFLKYSYNDGILFIKSGIFIKKERYIKKERVQTINFKAGIIFRIFDLVILEIETAGGIEEPEVNLPAIKKEYAEIIRENLTKKEAKITSKEDILPEDKYSNDNEKNNTYLKVPMNRIVLNGIASGGVGIIFTVIGLFFSFGIDIIPEGILENTMNFFSRFGMMAITSIILLALIISWTISVINSIIKNSEFSISKHGDEIEIAKGLIERKELSFKTHRIQGIKIIESPIRQLLGYSVIEFIIAGGVDEENQGNTIVHPMIKKSEINDFLGTLTDLDKNIFDLNNIPKRSLKRYLIRSLLPFLVIPIINLILIFNFNINSIIWLNLLIVLPFIFFGYLRFKAGGYLIDDNTLILRNRLFSKRTIIVNKKNIQHLSFSSNLFQRVKKLRTISICTLSSMLGLEFSLKDIDLKDADKIWTWLSRKEHNTN